MSQNRMILYHLQRRGTITPFEALNEMGCFRLAARIDELRRDGHPIRTEMVRTPKGKIHARYRLEPVQVELF